MPCSGNVLWLCFHASVSCICRHLRSCRQEVRKQALKSLESAEKGLEEDIPIDMIEIDLKETFDLLGNIIGIEYSEEIIDNLFKNFCVGK